MGYSQKGWGIPDLETAPANAQTFPGELPGPGETMQCARCAGMNPPGSRFCSHCGNALGSHRVAEPGFAPAPALAAFAEERKFITVMFADVQGSLDLIKESDPEKARALLDSLLGLMTAAVGRHEGTVSQVLGDGIMALFGAPVGQEDHALRACLAALELQRTMREYALRPEAGAGAGPKVRIGLNSGEVVMSRTAGDAPGHYRPVGVPTHLASRLEKLAEPGSILLSSGTMRLVEGSVKVVARGTASIRGIRDPLPLYELTEVMADGGRFNASLARGLTPLVGRRAEFAQLEALLLRARSGNGCAAGVRGDAGIGKSRLSHELVNSASAGDTRLWRAAGFAHAANIPYFPLTVLTRMRMDIGDQDDEATIRRKVAETLARFQPSLEKHADAMLALLNVAKPSGAWEQLEPFRRRQRLFDVLYELVLGSARDRPLIFLFEDIHWIDSETRAFVNGAFERLADARVFLLMTYRNDLSHDWGRHRTFNELTLERLEPPDVDFLCSRLLGTSAELAPVKALLTERAQGNPFYLEEIVRSLAEDGSLIGAPGDYRIGQASLGIRTPASLNAVISARVDHLPADAKNLLHAAAVIGQSMNAELLRSVADLPQEDFQRECSILHAAGMLQPKRSPTGLDLVFVHALILEVTAGSLTRSRRTTLHGRVIEALQRLYHDRLDEQTEVLADHALRGERWAEAVGYCLKACSRAVMRSANREALAAFEKGMQAAENLRDPKAKAGALVDLRLAASGALITLGHLPRAIENLHVAEALARGAGDGRRVAAVTLNLAFMLWMAGNHARGLEAAERALAAVSSESSRAVQFTAYHQIGLLRHALGRYSAAIAAYRKLLGEFPEELANRRLRSGWPVYPAVNIRTFLTSSYMHTGEFAQAERTAAEGEQFARDLNHANTQVMADNASGSVLLHKGEAALAMEVFSRSLALCRENDLHTMYPAVAADLGMAMTRCGDVPGAIALLEDALRRETYRQGGRYTEFFLLNSLCVAMLAAGRHADGRSAAHRAEALCRSTEEAGHLAISLMRVADFSVAAGDEPRDVVETLYREAILQARSCGMRPLEADCHRALGNFLERTTRARAEEEHGLARRLYSEMGIQSS